MAYGSHVRDTECSHRISDVQENWGRCCPTARWSKGCASSSEPRPDCAEIKVVTLPTLFCGRSFLMAT